MIEKPARALAKAHPLRNASQGEKKGGAQRFMWGDSQGESLAP
jgi:hypothetical protein